MRDFSQDGIALLDRATEESARYIIEISTRLPSFPSAAFSELLERQRKLTTIVDEVLNELRKVSETTRALNPIEEMGRFEQRYRIAIAHRNDEVELFGLDAPSKIRRQNLEVAYVTLSMRKKTSRKSRKEITKLISEQPDLVLESTIIQAKSFSSSKSQNEEAPEAFFQNIIARFPNLQLSDLRANLVHFLFADTENCDGIIDASPKLLIRGEAGSGKTTLLQWLAVNAASQRLKGILESWNAGVPFLIKLRDYAEKNLPSPLEFAKNAALEIADTMPAAWPDHVMSDGRGIILVDGVDELDEVKRNEVRGWIRALIVNFPKCRYVLTSRPTAIEEDWLSADGFDEAELLPMSWSDIDNLIDHWHNALAAQPSIVDTEAELQTIATQLKKQLRQSSALADLATSPLLCAMLCALYYERRQQLPPNRIALYEAAIRMLLHQRDRARGIGHLKLPDLTEEQKRAFLEHLAYRMMRNGFSATSVTDAVDEIARTRQVIQNLPVNATPEKITDLLMQRSGIIRSPAEGQVDFVHKTFQEFLCARAIVDAADLMFLVSQAHIDQWHETVILAAGLASLSQRNDFLKALVERGDREPRYRQSLYLLAVACLETAVKLSPEIEKLLDGKLRAVIPPRNMTDARSLKAAGGLAVPLLRRKSGFNAREAAASVRALAMIGGEEALSEIATYGADSRKTVIRELIDAWPSFDRKEYARRVLVDSPLDDGELVYSGSEQLDVLGHLKNLTSLTLSRNAAIKNLEQIKNLKSLRKLALSDLPNFISLDPMGMGNLTNLSLHYLSNLESIAPLERASSLEFLRMIRCQKITEYEPLSGLTNLRSLLISSEQESIFNAKKLSSKLEILNLGHKLQVPDFEIVAELLMLTSLTCAVAKDVSNEASLANLTKLSALTIYNASFHSLEWMRQLSALKALKLIHIKSVEDMTPIYGLKFCASIQISTDAPFDIDRLGRGSPNLVSIDLSNCQMEAVLPDISYLSNLKLLTLRNVSGLSDISSLSKLGKLRRITIVECKDIKDYSTLLSLDKAQIFAPALNAYIRDKQGTGAGIS